MPYRGLRIQWNVIAGIENESSKYGLGQTNSELVIRGKNRCRRRINISLLKKIIRDLRRRLGGLTPRQ